MFGAAGCVDNVFHTAVVVFRGCSPCPFTCLSFGLAYIDVQDVSIG